MSTTIHLPENLLAALDRRARKLKISRNALIARAVQNELNRPAEWSPQFFERLSKTQAGDAEAIEKMLLAIHALRTRKEPQSL